MNQADILKLAIDAGFGHMSGFLMPPHVGHITAELTRFAELVAQHEAKVREELIAHYDSLQSQYAELSVALDSAQHEREALLAWAVSKWEDEVLNRPLTNVHRRTLDDTWRQMIKHCGGDAVALIGPSHDDLLIGAARERERND